MNNSLTPVWGEVEFRVPLNAENLTIKVFDSDTAGIDDLIGECAVPYPFKNGSHELWMEKDKKFKDYPPSFIIGDDKK